MHVADFGGRVGDGGKEGAAVVDSDAGKVRLQLTVWEQLL